MDGLANAGVGENVDVLLEPDERLKFVQQVHQDWNRILERTRSNIHDSLLNCCNLLVVTSVDSNGGGGAMEGW